MNKVETCTLLIRLFADYERLTCSGDIDLAEAIARAIISLSKEQE